MTSPRPFPSGHLCLVVLLWLPSCSDDRTVGPPGAGEVGAACTDNSECNSGWCLADPSFPGNYCSKDCAADPAVCPDGSECHEYVADFKLCMSRCGGEDDCRDGYVCDYAVCRPPCTGNKFCHTGDICYNGRCKAKCTQNEDCPEDMRCQDGKCVPPCKKDEDCLPGFTCDVPSGTCKAKPGKPMGAPCSNSAECATDYCLPSRRICSITCKRTTQCPSAYTCGLETYDKDHNGTLESVESDCIPRKGTKLAGEVCAKDDDCAASHCYNGFCMEGCGVDSDCASPSLQCVTVSILLKGGMPKYNGCLPRQGVSAYSLGTIPLGELQGIDIPPTASSFILATEVPSVTESAGVGYLTDPAGNDIVTPPQDLCSYFSMPIRYLPREQYSSLFVPNTPAVKLEPGIYTYALSATNISLPVSVTLHLKLGLAQKGKIDLNWFFLNLSGLTCGPQPTLNAASAPTHPWMGKLRNNMTAILMTAGLTVGNETYHDLNNPALDVITLNMTGTSQEVSQLFASSKGMQGNAINIFLVRNIQASSAGGIILGLAGGLPGPPGVHGTVHSGVMMSMQTACFEYLGYNPAHTMAHEIGHYLGLAHTIESNDYPGYDDGKVVCPCDANKNCGPNLVCFSQIGASWCRGLDPIPDTDTSQDNLMYYAAESSQMFKGNKLTPGQIRVMLDNPMVGH